MCYVTRILLLSRLRSVRGLTTKTYDEPVSFCHRCGLFNDEAKNIKRNNVMDATISTSAITQRKNGPGTWPKKKLQEKGPIFSNFISKSKSDCTTVFLMTKSSK